MCKAKPGSSETGGDLNATRDEVQRLSHDAPVAENSHIISWAWRFLQAWGDSAQLLQAVPPLWVLSGAVHCC